MTTKVWEGETYEYESVTVSSSAVSLTSSTYAKSGFVPPLLNAVITVETDNIRFRTDGTDPTGSEGHLAKPDDVIILTNNKAVKNFRAIRTSTDATIRVSYRR